MENKYKYKKGAKSKIKNFSQRRIKLKWKIYK